MAHPPAHRSSRRDVHVGHHEPTQSRGTHARQRDLGQPANSRLASGQLDAIAATALATDQPLLAPPIDALMARPKSNGSPKNSTATIGFEAKLWIIANGSRLSDGETEPSLVA